MRGEHILPESEVIRAIFFGGQSMLLRWPHRGPEQPLPQEVDPEPWPPAPRVRQRIQPQ